MIKFELLHEFEKYMNEYDKAIYKLMNNSDINEYIYPLVNLVHQKIENELKFFISECFYDEKTFKDLKIDNTHNLTNLVSNKSLEKYYLNIDNFDKIFKKLTTEVEYFDNVLDNNTFINSRYSIETNENIITKKE